MNQDKIPTTLDPRNSSTVK